MIIHHLGAGDFPLGGSKSSQHGRHVGAEKVLEVKIIKSLSTLTAAAV